MKYKFSISNSRFCHSEIYDTEGVDIEWLAYYDDDELVDKQCLVKQVESLSGKHILFSLFGSLIQNDNCPPWVQAMANIDKLTVKFEKL